MLIRIFCFFILLIHYNALSQQNLVLNPSFEDVSGPLKCYLYGNENFPITNWTSASKGSIDAFSSRLASNCIMHPLNDSFAGKKPRTGTNYLGFTSVYQKADDYREYVRGNLSEPLEVGALYKIKFYVCLSNFANTATNNIGLAFINNKTPVFLNTGPIPLKPDVNYTGKPITERDKWTLLSFEFVPTKPNLDAFIIGNFFSTNETNFQVLTPGTPVESYMLLEDVSIIKEDITFDIPREICAGEKLTLPTTSKNGITGTWSPEFDPYNSKTYSFTRDKGDSNFKLSIDITVFNDSNFELIQYCENYEYVVEVKFKDSNLSKKNNYNWKLNGVLINNNKPIFPLKEYHNILKDTNELELSIINERGCKSIQKITFKKENLCKIQKDVSPNDEKNNKYFDLYSFGGVNLKILNRFGKVVYEKSDYYTEWKGQSNEGELMPIGNYYYQIDTNQGEVLSGWVQLIY